MQTVFQAAFFLVQAGDGIPAAEQLILHRSGFFLNAMQAVIGPEQSLMSFAEHPVQFLLLAFPCAAAGDGILQMHFRFPQAVLDLHQGLFRFGLLLMELVVAVNEQPDIQLLEAFAEGQIFPCHFGLLFQRHQMGFQLIQHIQHAHQIFVRMLEAVFRFLLAGTETVDACGFFKNDTPILTPLAEDFVDTALTDDGIAFLANARIPEQLNDVLQAAGRAIHLVFAVAAAVHPAGDADFLIFHRQLVIAVIKNQRHLAVVHGLALLGAVEDNILHAVATQGFGTLLAQHPAYRVADVALAGAVGAHNARHVLRKNDLRPFGKGLESINLQFGKAHPHPPYSSSWQRFKAARAAICSALFLL